jgi:hypothetical protein
MPSYDASPTPSQPRQDTALQRRVRDLEHEIQRLNLLNQSLWELLKERARFTDQQLEAKIKEVDLRDGVEDGRMSETPLRCPTCNRVSSSKHWKCLYCGQEFEKPIMG